MALEKRSIAIPLGEGMQEGVSAKLVDPPALADLVDARWDKRGEYAKRYGSDQRNSTGLAMTGCAVLEHQGALLQYGSTGAHVYNADAFRWEQPYMAGPRPSRVLTDPIIRGHGGYRDADLAYDPDSGLVCLVYRDDVDEVVRATFIDPATRATIAEAEMSSSIATQPRVVALDGSFLVFGFDAGDDLYVQAYATSAADYSFGSASLIYSGAPDHVYDVHVPSTSSIYAYLAVARGSSGWNAYAIDSSGSAAIGPFNQTAGRNCEAICVFFEQASGTLFIFHYNTDPSPDVISVDVVDDGLTTATLKTVMDLENPTEAERRITVAPNGNEEIWCFVSHADCNAGRRGGIEFRRVDVDGDPVGDKALVPGLILATRATSPLGRAVVGVSREVELNPAASAGGGPEEPLPLGSLMTPTLQSTGAWTLAALGRFGLDAVDMTSGLQSFHQISALTPIGSATDAEFWSAYRVRIASNPGSEFRSIANGWRWGIDVLRAQLFPPPIKATEAEGLTLLGDGVLASYDGQRAAELSVPCVPHRMFWSVGLAAQASGAEGTHYSISSTLGSDGVDQYTIALMRFKYLFRWIDARGNVHRSSVSEEITRVIFVSSGSNVASDPSSVDGGGLPGMSGAIDTTTGSVTSDTRILMFPKPSPTALGAEPGAKIQVELYRTAPVIRQYTVVTNPPAGNDTLDGEETRGAGDSVFRLVSILDIGDVTGYPNLGYVEDPIRNAHLYPEADSPSPYDDGGELGSEPIGPVLDVCSTQQRLFAIDAEDRLGVWFSKPFAKGYAPEFNSTLKLRCAAEGGDLVACETLDDKLVLFKERRIYVTPVFSGPDALGNGTAFQPPREIVSDTGCSNPRCMVKGPFGILFESERGIMVLGRDLSLTYVGEAIKDQHTAGSINAAVLVPNESEVRLQRESDALVWNYRVNAWSRSDDFGGLHATLWQGRYARLRSNSTVQVDLAGSYAADSGIRPMLEATTAWIKLAGLQGYQRVWTAMLLGDYYSGDLTVDVGYDYSSTWTDSHDFTEAQLSALSRMQLKIKPTRQKCQAIRFRVRERDLGGASPTIGRGFVLQGLQLEVGAKRGSFKMVPDGARR